MKIPYFVMMHVRLCNTCASNLTLHVLYWNFVLRRFKSNSQNIFNLERLNRPALGYIGGLIISAEEVQIISIENKSNKQMDWFTIFIATQKYILPCTKFSRFDIFYFYNQFWLVLAIGSDYLFFLLEKCHDRAFEIMYCCFQNT